MGKQELKISLKASDELSLVFDVDQNGTLRFAALTGVGGPAMLKLLAEWRPKLTGPLKEIPLPQGDLGPEMMLREVLLKARGEWNFPYHEEELCHCRAIATKVVDQAICSGAHLPETVSRWTSASTACGTCRRDVEAILKYRLKVA